LLALSGYAEEADQWLAQRRAEPKYRERRVRVHIKVSPEEAYLAVAHESPPWNFTQDSVQSVSPSLESPADRSLGLMQAFMDEVVFGGDGRSVTLVKLRTTD